MCAPALTCGSPAQTPALAYSAAACHHQWVSPLSHYRNLDFIPLNPPSCFSSSSFLQFFILQPILIPPAYLIGSTFWNLFRTWQSLFVFTVPALVPATVISHLDYFNSLSLYRAFSLPLSWQSVSHKKAGVIFLKSLMKSLGRCGPVGWASAHPPGGGWFDSLSGHVPGLWVWSWAGGTNINVRAEHPLAASSLGGFPFSPFPKNTNKQNLTQIMSVHSHTPSPFYLEWNHAHTSHAYVSMSSPFPRNSLLPLLLASLLASEHLACVSAPCLCTRSFLHMEYMFSRSVQAHSTLWWVSTYPSDQSPPHPHVRSLSLLHFLSLSAENPFFFSVLTACTHVNCWCQFLSWEARDCFLPCAEFIVPIPCLTYSQCSTNIC